MNEPSNLGPDLDQTDAPFTPEMLDKAAVSYRLVLTKADKVKASDLAAVAERTALEARTRPAAHPEVIATSSEGGVGIPELRAAVIEAIG